MANAKIIYPSGDPAPTTYNLPNNYIFGHELGYLEIDDDQRMPAGNLSSYAFANKKTFNLNFTRVSKAQLDYLTELWSQNYDLDLYLDGVNFDAAVQIMEPPDQWSEAAWRNGEITWSFSLMLQEI